MTTTACPPAPFSLQLSIVTQAWYSRPPPKRGDHWLVEFHCNCDDDDDDDDKELVISSPDISICSCIVMVFVILPCACNVFPLFLNVTSQEKLLSRTPLEVYGVGPARRQKARVKRRKSGPFLTRIPHASQFSHSTKIIPAFLCSFALIS